MSSKAEISRVSGPVVTATGLDAKMYDLVKVGKEKLLGEVIRIVGDNTIIQVYEETQGMRPGEPVENTGMPLSVELGPGLLTSIYDGIQRPLDLLEKQMGSFIERGATADGLDLKKKWDFKAIAKKGDKVAPGDIIGEVKESAMITNRVMIPPTAKASRIKDIKSGSFTVRDTIATLEDGTEIAMAQWWPVRKSRPVGKKLRPDVPLITGQRILDTFFPLAKGGTAAIPGGFGTGKTVTQHQLAKWADADVIVFIGCGERGNEMTDVLKEFPKLIDPKSGKPLMERTVMIVNTSNMPVAAREASVYTGMTIAEYYRDQGYDVSLLADSTSRWAEAMREVSSRLEEMPGEEGYPAYLATRLAEFYERAGRGICLGTDKKRIGSITAIGAVSPPGGDFSEPVTQNTLRVTKVFWALDSRLANRRHFPSINWLNSYSLYQKVLGGWFTKEVAPNYSENAATAMSLLQEESRLQAIVQLVGSDALPEKDRLVLEVARIIREGFLQQNAYHAVDTFCNHTKQNGMISAFLKYYELAMASLESGVPIESIVNADCRDDLMQLRFVKDSEFEKELKRIQNKMNDDFKKMSRSADRKKDEKTGEKGGESD
ncbi:MAG: V-type ATP synthase subunit A [archaeon]